MDQMSDPRPRLPRPRDLPLFVKLLVPFLLLILVIAAGGLFLVVRDLTSRAQAALDEDLLRRSLQASSRFHDRELYLLESVNFAANLRRMSTAVEDSDSAEAKRLLRSVLALKPDIEIVSIIGSNGRAVAELGTASDALDPRWAEGFVEQALDPEGDTRAVDLVRAGDQTLLAIAAPVCSRTRGCAPVGAAIVGMDLQTLAAEASGPSSESTERPSAVAVYDAEGRLLAATRNDRASPRLLASGRGDLVRRTETFDGERFQTLYSPLEIRGQRVGSLAVSLPADPAFSAAQGTAGRLTLLFFLAIGGVVAIGLLLSRWLLGQVRPLVDTSRELERGNLSARVPVVARDELGELAGTLNGMAEQLQASHATLERRVDERTEEVRRLLRERTEFFTGISHELRTPIAVILIEAKMLFDPQYAGDRGTTADAAGTIIGSAEQLLARVNDILDVARAESGRLEVDIDDVALQPLFRELDPALTSLASAAELSLTVDTASSLPSVRADRLRLKDVMLNLVENAVKYTPAGGTVSVGASARNGRVEISVADSGVGIPRKVGKRIFDPFYRVPGTKPVRGGTASGLGLALAKRVIEAQGGTISYTSRPEKGTTFTIALPRGKPGGKGDRKPRQPERKYVSTAKTRR
jgi:signal transduction histidine kinase